MKRRSIILYWLLLLLPTLAIAGVLFELLQHEQDRIARQALSSTEDRAEAIAETLQITVETLQEELTEALRNIPRERLRHTLEAWGKSNPLVRNTFIWTPVVGLQYPPTDGSETTEERLFTRRYADLFAPRSKWMISEAETPGRASLHKNAWLSKVFPEGKKKTQDDRNLVQAVQQLRQSRRQLEQMARVGQQGAAEVGPQTANQSDVESDWIPWFAENRLHILGWVAKQGGHLVYGIELELMSVLSRLVADFPTVFTEGVVYALVDGSGRILHQVGDFPLEHGRKPDVTASLSPHLPHWQVAAYFTGTGASIDNGRGFVILSGLLLAIFVAAIIIGGSLLLWQAHRNSIDAMQKTTFVSNVSHELKTPLTSIRMYAELLGEQRVKDPAKQKRYLEVIIAESQRLTRLVNNVLDFSRLEEGRKKYHLTEIDLSEFLKNTAEAHRLRIQQAGLQLKDQIPEDQAVAQVDRDAIEQVVLNILDNAIKYAADGGEIAVAGKRTNGWYELSIKDRGPGIPAAHREKIFEKFHRVDDSLTARQPGAGLGLSIARRILGDLGGDLSYEQRKGGGSCFVMRIPIMTGVEEENSG